MKTHEGCRYIVEKITLQVRQLEFKHRNNLKYMVAFNKRSMGMVVVVNMIMINNI